MRGITLRRIKTDIIDGKPILSLPPRHERIIILAFQPAERELYNKIHQKGREIFENIQLNGTADANFANLLTAILRMRQACLHPSLVTYNENEFAPSKEYFLYRCPG
jgi:SNF2 family DNA or RNA helicase